jgi:excisionase family DNA binding protein
VVDVSSSPDQVEHKSASDLANLVGDWLTVPDIAERLGVPLSRVRQYIADRDLLALRTGERNVVFTPDPTLPVPGAPIDALVAGHKTEVRRRAQVTAF